GLQFCNEGWSDILSAHLEVSFPGSSRPRIEISVGDIFDHKWIPLNLSKNGADQPRDSAAPYRSERPQHVAVAGALSYNVKEGNALHRRQFRFSTVIFLGV